MDDARPIDSWSRSAAGGRILGWLIAVTYLGFLDSFAIGWFLPPSLVGIGDWDWVFSDAWLSASGLLERGWPAEWSIQLGGGVPLAADPESLSHSPFLSLPLALGPIVGTKLLVVVLILLGLVGCHRLGLRWIDDDLGATVFAFAFVFSGHFAIHLRAGHLPWAAFYLVPWVLLYLDRLLFDPTATRAASIGFIASLVALFSGLVYHALVYFLLPVGVLYVLLNVRRLTPRRVGYVSALLICAVTLTTFRHVAVIEWQQTYPRIVFGVGGMPWAAIGEMLVTPIEDYKEAVTWGSSGIWEYWSYVGVVTTMLAIASVGARERWRALALASFVLGCILAWRGPWGSPLEPIASQVPFLSSVRVYSRFIVLAVFGMTLSAGGAIGALRRRSSKPLAWLSLLLLAAIVGEYALVVRPIWSKVFALPVEDAYPNWGVVVPGPRYATAVSAPPFQERARDREMFNSRMLPQLMAGAIVAHNAYITMAIPWSRPPDGRVVNGPEGMAYRLRNHEIDLSGDFRPGQQIQINLRLTKASWRVVDPESVRVFWSGSGMIAILILKPCQDVRFVFRSDREFVGWIISAVAVAFTFAVVRRGT